MLSMPRRKSFPTRDDFVAAFHAAADRLRQMYDDTLILTSAPDWASSQAGSRAFHVDLPSAVAENEMHVDAALASIVRHMSDKGRSVERMARVEAHGLWTVWVETDGRTN